MNQFGNYINHVNDIARKTANKSSKQIKVEINKINRSDIPRYEKRLIKQLIYNNLSPKKQSKLSNSFGEVSPQTTAAATQAAISAAVTQAAVTQAATTQAVATQPVATQPAATQPPVTGVPGVTGATVPTTGYNNVAAAVQQLESATQNLLGAAAGTGTGAALGNITGFGRKTKSQTKRKSKTKSRKMNFGSIRDHHARIIW